LFKQHNDSERHQQNQLASDMYKNMRAGGKKSVASQLSLKRAVEIQENRDHVKYLLRCTRYLGHQGLPFRGHDESKELAN